MLNFDIYAKGLCACSVCSSLSLDDTVDRVNMENPTGISSQWRISTDGFADGSDNPHPCEKYPETHKHYLFKC